MSQKAKKKPQQKPTQIFLQSQTKKQEHNKTWTETAQYTFVYNIKNREQGSLEKRYFPPPL